jgi:Zn-dependent protease
VNDTVRVGRVAGVPIGLNWTWALVFGLFVWSLARDVFPATNPGGLRPGTYAAMALVAALLFFGSLLLHEVGHALVARREGIEVEGITLWVLGGVARIHGTLPSPGAELRTAGAGPLVTAVLALAFGGITLATDFAPAVDGVAAWLAYVNLVVLGFNLLPALPLDGGRLLRAGLWQARGDFVWASVVAAATGRVLGIALIAAGFLALGVVGVLMGAWLVVIGWFVFQFAGAEAESADVAGKRRARASGPSGPDRAR